MFKSIMKALSWYCKLEIFIELSATSALVSEVLEGLPGAAAPRWSEMPSPALERSCGNRRSG